MNFFYKKEGLDEMFVSVLFCIKMLWYSILGSGELGENIFRVLELGCVILRKILQNGYWLGLYIVELVRS